VRILFFLFLIIPIIEIILLIEVGGYIGALNTALLVVLTAVIGSLMLRQQGLATFFRARERIDSGQIPLQEMMEGICLAVGGALLVTPGFFTDAVGFALLMPHTRRWLAASLGKRLHLYAAQSASNGFAKPKTHDNQSGDIIEGEVEPDDESRHLR